MLPLLDSSNRTLEITCPGEMPMRGKTMNYVVYNIIQYYYHMNSYDIVTVERSEIRIP